MCCGTVRRLRLTVACDSSRPQSLARASTYKARPGMNGTNGRQAKHAKRSQEARASKLAMRRAAAKAH